MVYLQVCVVAFVIVIYFVRLYLFLFDFGLQIMCDYVLHV